MSVVLSAENIVFGYPTRGILTSGGMALKALDDVSIELNRGEVLGIVGESGCGKSTLLRTIIGLNRGYGGTVRYEGKIVEHGGSRASLASFRAGVQMIFQDPGGSLNPFQSVRHSISSNLKRGGSAEAFDASLVALVESVGMNASSLDRRPSEFSGGQLQRLAVAKALASKPNVLLCDEPTSALDVSIQAQILRLFEQLKREGQSFVFVTHNLGVLGHIADSIIVMRRGRIVEQGKTRQVINHPSHPYTATLIAAAPRLTRKGALLANARRGLAAGPDRSETFSEAVSA